MAEGSALREVFATFGIEVEDAKLEALEKKVAVVTEKLATFGQVAKDYGALLGAGASFWGLNKFVGANAAAAGELSKLSNRLGISLEDIQRFGYVAKMSGLSLDEAGAAMKFLNKAMADAGAGGKQGSAEFQKLGVHVKDANGNMRPAMEILPEIAEGFTKLKNPADQTALALKVFGRGGLAMVPLLKKGKAGIAELGKEFDDLGIQVSDADLGALAAYRKSVKRLNSVNESARMTIAARLAPAFTWLFDKALIVAGALNKFVQETRVVQFALAGIAAVALYKSVPALLALGKSLAGLLLANPAVTFTILGLTLLGLALEDLYTFATGGDSVIGDMLKSMFGDKETAEMAKTLAGALTTIVSGFTGLRDILKTVGEFMGDTVYKVVQGAIAMAKGVGQSIDAVRKFVNGDNSGLDALGASTGAVASGSTGELVPNAAPRALPQIKAAPLKASADAFLSPTAATNDAPRSGYAGATTTVNITLPFQSNADPKTVATTVAKAVTDGQKKNQAALAAVSTGGR